MFHGSIVAIVTPMTDNGAIDFGAFEQLLQWHLDVGTDGVVVLGTTGESATVTNDERKLLIECAVSVLQGKIPCIVGTGSNSTVHALELTRQAMELGADGALLVTPYYNKPPQQGLFEHFSTIAKQVPIPQILYNVPSRTGCDLLPETMQQLAAHSNIVALKEATGDLGRLRSLVDLNLEVDLLSGDDATAAEFMLSGGKGVISVAANVVPRQIKVVCKLALQQHRGDVESVNYPLQNLYQQLFVQSNPIPVKWLLAEMGSIQAGIRLPLVPLASDCYANLKAAAIEAGVQF